jgi:hypothetical protein
LNLSSNRLLTDEQRSQLWLLIDSREWFIRMVAKDYNAELEQIDRQLEKIIEVLASFFSRGLSFEVPTWSCKIVNRAPAL